MKQEKKIPSILALLFLLGGTFAGINLSQSSRLFRSKASTSCQPINPQVTNITHNSADISFTTAANCPSSLLIDDRTITSFHSPSFVHYFSVPDLEADRNYAFSFIVSGTTWQQSQYQVQTASNPPGSVPISGLAWGRVLNLDRSPAEGAILYLNIPGALPLSSLVTSSGNWNISLATSFNSLKDNWFTPPPGTEEDIVIISSDGQTTQVTANTSVNDPVPDIIIGQNSFEGQPPPPSSGQDFSSLPTSLPLLKKLKITNPQDNESIFLQRPEFFGDAPVNSQVIITIHSSQVIDGQTTANTQGNWSWSPPQDISLGDHTISVKTKDAQTGLWQTITHNFTVYANDDDTLSFSSSPSATIVPPTSTPTATGTPLEPTASIGATPTPTIQPTTRTAKPATDSGIPSPGFSLPTFFIVLLSSIFVILSYFLLS